MTVDTALSVPYAVRLLAARCDGASTVDGQGFNQRDAEFGKSLAQRPSEHWTPKQLFYGHRMLRTYRGQLLRLGVDYDALPVPPDPSTLAAAPPGPGVRPAGAPTSSQYQARLAPTTRGAECTIELASPYNPGLVNAIKAMPGRRFDGERRVWTLPLSDDNLEDVDALLRRFHFERHPGVSNYIDPRLADLREDAAREEALADASRAGTADVRVDGLGGVLRPYQQAAVAYAVATGRTFIADEQGLGKTVEALATLQKLDAFPALIICPNTPKRVWRKHAIEWLPGKSVAVLNREPDLFATRSDIVVVNYDSLRKYESFLESRPWQAIVCDESHKLKTPSSQRTKTVMALMEKAQPRVRLMVTGTALPNRPAEAVSQLEILGQLTALTGAKDTTEARRIFKSRFIHGMRHQELGERLRRTCMIRRLKKDVLTELPPKVPAFETLEISNRPEYEAAERDVIQWIEERAAADAAFADSLVGLDEEQKAIAIKEHAREAGARARRAEALVKINALSMIAARGKLEAATRWIQDFLENDQKLVVFAEHIELQKALAAAFPGCAEIFAKDEFGRPTTAESREVQVDRFQGDPACRLIVCSLAIGGESITLTAASDVAILELGWTPGGIDQAGDRCHRYGQTDSVTVWHLLAENTIDEYKAELIDKKRTVTSAVLDGTEAVTTSILTELMGKLRAKGRAQ